VAGKTDSPEATFNSALNDAIPYFGLTADQQADVNQIIVDYIKDRALYLYGESDLPSDLVDNLNNNTDLDYIECRCEKVMIKDEIATEEGLSEIEQRNYVASIYMPNKDINVLDYSMCVSTKTPDKPVAVSSLLEIDGISTSLVLDSTDLSDGKRLLDPIDGNATQIAQFKAIDTNNPEAFADGVSLIEAIRILGKEKFTLIQTEDEESVYTWKPSGEDSMLYLMFASDEGSPFIFSDFAMDMVENEENIA